jgi:hypothetical protein
MEEEDYSDYKEIGYPKKGLLKTVSKIVGNVRKPKYKFGKASRSPYNAEERAEEDADLAADYLDPFEKARGKDELRKKKSTKSKTKRKSKKKGCGCK